MKGRPLTDEQKAALAAGRRAAAERKAVKAATTAEDVIDGRVEMPRQQYELPALDAGGYEFFLAGLDAEMRELLTEVELRQIFAAEQTRVVEERRAQKKKAAAELARHAARMASGMVPAAQQEAMTTLKRNSQTTRLRIELPPSGDNGEIPDIGLRVDQRVFIHGIEYSMTEAQAASMRETMYRMGEMQLMFEGKNRRARAWMMSRTQMANGRSSHIDLNADGSLA